jgi:hypothetical protein
MRSFPRGVFTIPSLTLPPPQAGGEVDEVQGIVSGSH